MTLPLIVLLAIQTKQSASQRTIYDIEIAPNDQWMAITRSTDDIWIYSLSGKLLRTLHHKPGSRLVDVEISPDGKNLACSNSSGTGDYCPIWSTSTWKEVTHVGIPVNPKFYNAPASIEYAASGKYLIGPSTYGFEIFAWNTKTGRPDFIAKRQSFAFFGMAVNQNSSLVLLNERGKSRGLRFWDFENSPAQKKWGTDISDLVPEQIRNMKFSHDGNLLFIITAPQKMYSMLNVVKPVGGKCSVVIEDKVQNLVPRDVAWAGDDSEIWVSGLNGQIVCFDPRAGALKKHWTAHNRAPIHAIAATHRGHTVASGADGDVCIWNGDSGKLLRTITLP